MSKSLKFRFKSRAGQIDGMIAELEQNRRGCLEYMEPVIGSCRNCNHPIGAYPGGVLYHARKGCEYSVTCWLCQCRKAEI